MTGPSFGRNSVCGLLVAAMLFGGTTIARAQTSTVPCYSYDENCKGIIKKTAIIAGALIGVLIVWKILSGGHKRAESNSAPKALNVYYNPTAGTALLHMVMQLESNNCPGSWAAGSARLTSGKLPPGLKLEADRTIAGTPLGSGVWQARIELSGLRCEARNGQVRTYPDKSLNVTIKIE